MSQDRLLDLLACEATQLLHDDEVVEVERLLEEHDDAGRDDFALAAAAVDLAWIEDPAEELPASIRTACIAAARAGGDAGSASRSSGLLHLFPLGLAAAAAALIAIGAMLWGGDPSDAVTLAWKSLQAKYQSVSGKVVWSDSEQRGYMEFENLPVNDPQEAQYQLWIVDSKRDKHPVDGGVFNATGTGKIRVPVDSKLRVDNPAAFVITLEQPGGVVVSDGPHLIIAAP